MKLVEVLCVSPQEIANAIISTTTYTKIYILYAP